MLLTKFGKGMVIAGLNVLKYITYIVFSPIVVVFMLYGVYFVVAGFAWLVLFCAGFYGALLILAANFYMAIVALFVPSLWSTMGSMWSWLWSWFSNGNIWLWPHLVRSFPPYIVAGVILMPLYEFIKRINTWTKQVKKIPYVIAT